MKREARITSKGQVTVPHEIRRALGVRKGDRLLFEQDGPEVRVRPVKEKSAFEKYRGAGTNGAGNGRKKVMKWMRELRGQ